MRDLSFVRFIQHRLCRSSPYSVALGDLKNCSILNVSLLHAQASLRQYWLRFLLVFRQKYTMEPHTFRYRIQCPTCQCNELHVNPQRGHLTAPVKAAGASFSSFRFPELSQPI